jgi:hypothetical protein
LLLQQESLVNEVVGPSLPLFANESPVLRQWLDAAFRLSRLHRATMRVIDESEGLSERLVDELPPFSRRIGKMRCPIQIGMSQRRRRQSGRKRAIAACVSDP